ncbi:MAG TPA: membrane protein insertase YidC [Methylomirabilota bacterium]|jgi:YidC/Oxa1 family membrane protein insertase|nr:membrane protein insertase YidC [Methylomirabilota bacterium]
MERRAILAALLMAALLMVYQLLFVKPPESQHAGAPAQKKEAPAGTPAAPPSGPSAPSPAAIPPVTPKEPAVVPERSAVVETPLYRARVESRGGRLTAWDLRYRGDKPMIVSGELGPRGLMVSRSGAPPAPVAFSLSSESLKLGRDQPQGELKLVGEDGFGLRITQTLRFHAESYVVEQEIAVENRHAVAQSAQLVLAWQAPVEWPQGVAQKFQGQHPIRSVRAVGGAVRREDLGKVTTYEGPGQWVGLESEWYLTAYAPMSGNFQLVEAKHSEDRPGAAKPVEVAEVGMRATLPALQPGQSWQGRVLTYVGPKEYERLKALGVGLEKSIYFGGFPLPQTYGGLPMEWLAVPILWVMHLFYAYTRNYGIAIILLTVITKVLFFPLTIKSMTSMKAMQALQPQINAIRSKYKSDAQRMQQETMALYRAHKVNPLGGCLPMVVQVPIFYALYVALSVSVELQNQPFICFGRLFGVDLWICDLASQDPTYVLPLLMGASMFIQQKMTPVMGDPRQAKMMLFMPIVFTFMFLNLPSGLVLYWTLSNVLQIAQQKYMERRAKAEKPVPRLAKRA